MPAQVLLPKRARERTMMKAVGCVVVGIFIVGLLVVTGLFKMIF